MKPECIAFLARQRQTYKPTPEFRHKIDNLGRNLFRGADKVALVLAVLIIHKDNHFARAKLIKHFRYLAKIH
jgi:hypothetical protein